MLAEAAALAPKAVVCLTSALQFYDLTLQRPSSVWLAIDRDGWKPRSGYPPMRFVRFSRSRLDEGVERHWIEGVQVPDLACRWETSGEESRRPALRHRRSRA